MGVGIGKHGEKSAKLRTKWGGWSVSAGKKMHKRKKNGWVGDFGVFADFFSMCSSIFFLTPPLN